MREMLTREQSGSLEVPLEVSFGSVKREENATYLTRSGAGTWHTCKCFSNFTQVGFNILIFSCYKWNVLSVHQGSVI